MKNLVSACSRMFAAGSGGRHKTAIEAVREAADRDPEAARFYLRQRVLIGDGRGASQFYQDVVLARYRDLVLGPGEQLSLVRMLEFGGGRVRALRQACELFLSRYPVESGWEEVAVIYGRIFLDTPGGDPLAEPLRHLRRVEGSSENKRWCAEAQRIREALEMSVLLRGGAAGAKQEPATEAASAGGEGSSLRKTPGLQMRVASRPKRREIVRRTESHPANPLPDSGGSEGKKADPVQPRRMSVLLPLSRAENSTGDDAPYQGSPELARGNPQDKIAASEVGQHLFADSTGLFSNSPIAQPLQNNAEKEMAGRTSGDETTVLSAQVLGGVALQLNEREMLFLTDHGQVRVEPEDVILIHSGRVRLSRSSRSDQLVVEFVVRSSGGKLLQIALWEKTCVAPKCRLDGEPVAAEDALRVLCRAVVERVGPGKVSRSAAATAAGEKEECFGSYPDYLDSLREEARREPGNNPGPGSA